MSDLRRAGASALLAELAYPDLPIVEHRDEIVAAIREHRVIVVAGETGSGKSTQIAKMCLEAGRGVDGLIGHTQPRRLAARSVARRVADELGVELGREVGYTVRFDDRVRPETLVRSMTDGVILAEIRRDRRLRRYDTIVVDEAHERSLNIDFLLGYLTRLVRERDDLRVVIMSATIDTERIAAHFGGAPVFDVAGRVHPVEIRYRPPAPDADQPAAIADAVGELVAQGHGDVLVFVSGEREVRDAAEALSRLDHPPVEVLPLYARLTGREQDRVFQAHRGVRVVVSTNVAETSLTVPGIRSVVDTGTARISRYSHRLKVQRLPIEPVSQASAAQRAGRCGRLGPGVAVRLYDEDDFAARAAFTDPEIVRTNLAAVILQMTALGLGDVAEFPFVDPPDRRAIADGYALLDELGALASPKGDGKRTLTDVGRQLARLPVDPRYGRMIIEAARLGCAREVIVIVAALSIHDPRERPAEERARADELHRRFVVPGSDFLTLVKMWDHLRDAQRSMSSGQFRRACRAEFLHHARIREWQDLVRQLREAAASIGIVAESRHGDGGERPAAHPDHVHRALLPGLLSHAGVRTQDGRTYRGARGAVFSVAGGSALGKSAPAWVVAAELVETNAIRARMVAGIRPEWLEAAGAHLVKRSYDAPRWDQRQGRAVVTERVTLLGLPIVAGRTVGLDRVDTTLARELFIRHALVEGEWSTHHRFPQLNAATIERAREAARRRRRADPLDGDVLFDFYDSVVPHDVVSSRHFDAWYRRARGDGADPMVLALGADDDLDGWPDTWADGQIKLSLRYCFEPGADDDGITAVIPVEMLNQIDARAFEWLVPGERAALGAAMVRTLPKDVRRDISPLAEAERDLAAALTSHAPRGRVRDVAAAALRARAGRDVDPAVFDLASLPPHLRMRFEVIGADGRVIAAGRDLDALRRALAADVRRAVAAAVPVAERSGLTDWTFGDIAPEVTAAGNAAGVAAGVRGYPALVDDRSSVSLRVFTRPEVQAALMPGGVRRLLVLATPSPRQQIERAWRHDVKLAVAALAARGDGWSLRALVDDCTLALAGEAMRRSGRLPWTADEFALLRRLAAELIGAEAARAARRAGDVVVRAAALHERIDRLVTAAVQASAADLRRHLDRLVRPGFVTATELTRFDDLDRYLAALDHRLRQVPESPRRDAERLGEVRRVERQYADLLDRLPPSEVTDQVSEFRWQLEELRVGVFAQHLGTARPVSPTRLRRELATLDVKS
jgi:ATP-dependent helicase HrpA